MTCDAEWPMLDRMAARQIEDPMLRFGGEDAVAPLDPTVNTQVLGSDPMRLPSWACKNVDRVMAMLIPATTQRGQDYTKLAEMYQALLVKRNNELAAVASWSAASRRPATREGEALCRLRRCPRNGNGRR